MANIETQEEINQTKEDKIKHITGSTKDSLATLLKKMMKTNL